MSTTTPGAPRGLQGTTTAASKTGNGAVRAPRGLDAAGRRLWRSLTGHYDFEEHELAVLVVACRTVDRLEDVATALADAPLTTTNARGDLVSHPLLVEQRQQSITLTRLLASLRLPTGETEDGDLVRPQRRGGARGAYGIRGSVSGGAE
jgi:hypothetical protein